MSHLKFDIILMMRCLLLATRLVIFGQDSGLHPIDIPLFFPVYSTSPLIMVNQMDLCSNISHLYTVSTLNKRTMVKRFSL